MGLDLIRKLKEQAKLPKEKKRYKIPAKSKKKLAQEAAEKKLRGSDDSLMEQWFKARRKELVGTCSHCGGKSCKNSNTYFRHSICHILPKRIFKSVATHESNWIELCFFDNSCHTRMDNNILDMTEMNCWNEIVMKFQKIYPSIAAIERKYIPDTLLQYLNTDQ